VEGKILLDLMVQRDGRLRMERREIEATRARFARVCTIGLHRAFV
jgi:hypothetical protein